MNQFIAQLFAALAALSAAIGSPVEVNKSPDRPAIVQAAPASTKNAVTTNSNKNASAVTKPSDDKKSAVDNSSKLNHIEIKGTVESVNANGNTTTITVGNQTISVDSKTKVEGKLETGVKVQIEAIQQINGSLVASQVEVKKDDVIVKPSDDTDTKGKTDDSKDVKKDEHSNVKAGSDDSKIETTSNDSKSSDDKSGSSSSEDSKSGDDKGSSGSSGDSKSGDSKSSETSGKSSGGSDDSSEHH